LSPYTPRRQIIKKIKQQKIIKEQRNKLFRIWLKRISSLFHVSTHKFWQTLRLFILTADKFVKKSKTIIVYSHKDTNTADKVTVLPSDMSVKKNQKNKSVKKLNQSHIDLKKKYQNLLAGLARYSKGLLLSLTLLQKKADRLLSNPKVFKLGIKRLYSSLPVWKFRWLAMCLILAILTIFNIYSNYELNAHKTTPSVIKRLNLWPGLPDSYFMLSKAYMEHGNENEARMYFKKGEFLYKNVTKLGLGLLFEHQYQETQQILQAPQRRREQIAHIEQLEEIYPFNWQLLAIKAQYQKELYMENDYNRTLEEINWLYPQNEFTASISQSVR